MNEENYIGIKFMIEKKEGHGEDAPPLLVIKNNAIAVGVFDGLGGSGATKCKSDYGEGYTKAYVASRIVRDEIEDLFKETLGVDPISSDLLEKRILQRLRKEQDKFQVKTDSKLSSKLLRDYPTTMAIVMLKKEGKELHVNSFWAGDSRCYLWTKNDFCQISVDDLAENNDPMDNLRNDAAISNCVCADRDFKINNKQIKLPKESVVIISATDGCFGYYPTPMHFEYILKKCLKKSNDASEWEEQIKQEFQKVTGDDTSISMVAIGFESFRELKKMGDLSNRAIKKLLEEENRFNNKKKDLKRLENNLNNKRKTTWEDYKQKYMKYTNN